MYVIYNIESTKIIRKAQYDVGYASIGAAKAAMTRNKIDKNTHTISEYTHFFTNIEKTETRKNFMSGKEFETSVNSNYTTCPSSETYWST
jgi:hypothetical protein